jgi:hypothetical protein
MSSADNAYQLHLARSRQANWRLAHLLGWTAIFDAGGSLLGTPVDGALNSRGQALIPDWCNDSAACFSLLQSNSWELNIANPALLGGADLICIDNIEVTITDHPDQCAALRYALVLAQIARLEAKS